MEKYFTEEGYIMAFYELNDVFGYQDANEIKQLWASDTAPQQPGDGEVWLDTSVTPNRLKRYNEAGTAWDTIGDMTAADVLNLLKTVDGTGSGIDADMVDGLEASSFVRNDANSSVNADTQWQSSQKVKLGSAADAEFYSDGTDVYLQLNKDNGRLIFKLNGTSQVAEVQSAMTGSAGAFSNHPVLRIRQTADQTYNIGDTHGELQFYTDDTGGDFPGVQAYIRSMTTRGNSITNPDTGLSFGVSYTPGTATEKLRLEGVGDLHLFSDSSFTVGSSQDLVFRHDGSGSYLVNEVNNGADLHIKNQSHGEKIIMSCEDTSGTEKTLLTLDPETDRVTTKLDGASLPDLWNDNGSGLTNNLFIQSGIRNSVGDTSWALILFDVAFTSTPRVICSAEKDVSNENVTVWIQEASTTYFRVRSSQASTKVHWIAIGEKA
jgi:hypothetical protein